MTAPKKNLIYEAALSLVYESNDFSSIKVADIADRAGIGKGTVYEYFQSKEQVIGEALLYMWEQALESFALFLEENEGFKEAYYGFLRNFKMQLGKNRHIYKLLTMNPASFSVPAAIEAFKFRFEEMREKYFALLEKLAARSVSEGIIKDFPSRFDWQTAILSSLTCIYIHQHFPDESPGEEAVLDKAYAVYVKLLGD
ncbi:MAG: TetR/AcrR family transcriptional regulator [Bacillota bacterium]|jgi:AcrR family transcriptional regulator|nr:TetR/AcrR family transcriptional regulator [Bacillota bacterium]HOC06310.1 TetR/AcrR family transcriptional regulator [Bacillota bacterium]HPZ23034.1 TetR/AcrR family transcriptional regulator [Bacillota bacterium]HQD20280.1 TetR/AcrR family transcriptional regulator [Bacillota bacterium]